MGRRQTTQRTLIAAATAMAIAGALAGTAWAWSSYAAFSEAAADVRFTGVELSSPNDGPQRCTVTARIRYAARGDAARGFTVTVGTSAGHAMSGLLSVRKAGGGELTIRHDTSGEGCWGAKVVKPTSLSVRHCGAPGCR